MDARPRTFVVDCSVNSLATERGIERVDASPCVTSILWYDVLSFQSFFYVS